MKKLTDPQTSMLVRLYDEQPLAVDRLPYTNEFNKLVADFRFNTGVWTTHRSLYTTLMTLSKTGGLPTKTSRSA